MICLVASSEQLRVELIRRACCQKTTAEGALTSAEGEHDNAPVTNDEAAPSSPLSILGQPALISSGHRSSAAAAPAKVAPVSDQALFLLKLQSSSPDEPRDKQAPKDSALPGVSDLLCSIICRHMACFVASWYHSKISCPRAPSFTCGLRLHAQRSLPTKLKQVHHSSCVHTSC